MDDQQRRQSVDAPQVQPDRRRLGVGHQDRGSDQRGELHRLPSSEARALSFARLDTLDPNQ